MKNSKEMADAVFRIRDEYIEKKHRRNEAVKRAAMIGVPALAAFALIIGAGAAFDRQEIGMDGVPETVMETAPVSTESTVVETKEAPEETKALKDTAEKSTTTKKETMPATEPVVIEENLPETMIPDGQSGTPADIFREETAVQTTSVAALTEVQPETASEPVFQPDEEIDAIPESTETVNQAVAFTAEQLFSKYPTIYVDKEYICTGETVAAEMLGEVIVEATLNDGFADNAVIYSLENGRIAVKFGRADFYIVYKAKEEQ